MRGKGRARERSSSQGMRREAFSVVLLHLSSLHHERRTINKEEGGAGGGDEGKRGGRGKGRGGGKQHSWLAERC